MNPIAKRILWVVGGVCVSLLLIEWRFSLASIYARALVGLLAISSLTFSWRKARS